MKKSGILLHISSLPSNYGIGSFGKSAYEFVDFLAKAHQSYWQILPLGQTGFGDSPYSSFSAFAGNPYFIDFDLLKEDGLLKDEDYKRYDWKANEPIDYGDLFDLHHRVLEIAFDNFKPDVDYYDFCNDNAYWLNDYIVFMDLKLAHFGASWQNWTDNYKNITDEEKHNFKAHNYNKIKYWRFVQYEFYKQYFALKKYANKKGIKIFGDCPIYVSYDSCDVWSNRQLFKLDDNGLPIEVAGVAPDYFSESGQVWGNPLYDWDYMKKDKYKWWIKRLRHYEKMYDVLRIDHFIGLVSYYGIKYGASDGKNGITYQGPGYDFIETINKKINKLEIVAEDLGIVTDEVRELLKKSKYPGMRLMCFGYDGDMNNDNMLQNIPENCVAYLTSHDTTTCLDWLNSLDNNALEFVKKNINFIDNEKDNWSLINALMSSKANLTIVQFQDLLGLGKEYRMNTPGTSENNWAYRLHENDFNDDLAKKLYHYTKINNRDK